MSALIWRLAARSLFRHPGRLSLTLLLLSGAFAMIVCFKGFKTHVLDVIQKIVIDTQYGHLQIAKRSFWENTPVDDASDKMLSNPEELRGRLEKIEGIEFVSPRIGFYALLNRDDKSVVARFNGVRPNVESRLQKILAFDDGSEFSNSKEILLSSGLVGKLKVKSGDEVTLVSPTLGGGMNAMDLQIQGIFRTGIADIDSGTVFIGFDDAQKVLDTAYADQLLIRVRDESQVERIRGEILKEVTGTDLVVKSWRELGELYGQVEAFYNFQNFFIEVIILLLLFLSVANTMSMNVFERISEIGTLRALGDYESDIRRLFLVEAVLLGILSIVIGVPLSFLLIKCVSFLGIYYELPLASRPIPVVIVPTYGAFFEAAAVCFFSVIVASLWPARKGSQFPIVSALSAKI